MKIKKTPSNNQYIRAGNAWVRNFAHACNSPISNSCLYERSDYHIVVRNEEGNKVLPRIADEKLIFSKVVIISDGYDFDNRHKLLAKLPPDVCVLATNGALKHWKLATGLERRAINAYVVNNPYAECLRFLPAKSNKYYPVCVASIRTNMQFLKEYLGDTYVYCPTPERIFGLEHSEKYFIDDYRNPICAAIGLAYQMGVEKLMLACCDESFAERRDYAVQLKNGLWTYPQHLRSEAIIDANLHWLTHQEGKEVRVGNWSSGGECVNAEYITSERDVLQFFDDKEEEAPNDA